MAKSVLQGIVTPATIVTACSAALAPLYNWLLVDVYDVGLAGAALANDAVQVLTCCTVNDVCALHNSSAGRTGLYLV